MRNSPKMLPFVAPTDFLMPISWVRSATETSMMFITPIPPTMREMAEIRERMSETEVRRELEGWEMSEPARIVKLLSDFFSARREVREEIVSGIFPDSEARRLIWEIVRGERVE